MIKQPPESNTVPNHWSHWAYLPNSSETFENLPESTLLEYMPWYDSPNPSQYLQQQLEQGSLALETIPYLTQWVNEGYFVLSNLLPESDLDGFNEHLNLIWKTNDPLPSDFSIFDVRLPNQDQPVNISHQDLIANYTPQQRQEIEQLSNWRLGTFECYSEFASNLFHNPVLQQVCSTIMQIESKPLFSLSFGRGSKQPLHQDMAVFHVLPKNYIVGVWIATEDIHEESGPLEFYPGSHQVPMYSEFTRYPHTNLRTCSPETIHQYWNHLDNEKDHFPKKHFICKKGDALFWHGMLIHGGAPVINPALTRRSFVIHFLPEGSNWGPYIQGPVNW